MEGWIFPAIVLIGYAIRGIYLFFRMIARAVNPVSTTTAASENAVRAANPPKSIFGTLPTQGTAPPKTKIPRPVPQKKSEAIKAEPISAPDDYQRQLDPLALTPQETPSLPALTLFTGQDDLVRAIILQEVLSRPRAFRYRVSDN